MFPDPPDADRTLAATTSARGEVVLRRRARDGALELRVNGVFVMDNQETRTEEALAALALAAVGRSRTPAERGRPVRVLVGGLGLGFTLARFVESPAVDEVVVAEIEPALVEWHRSGLIADTAGVLASPLVQVCVGDVRTVVREASEASYDAIVLDVDNGPGFLVYDDNAAVYQEPFVASCHAALRAGGALVVWSADEAPSLVAAAHSVFGAVTRHAIPVTLGDRAEAYLVYVALRCIQEGAECPAT